MTIRLVIADDHEIIRSGLRALLAGTNVHIVGEATSSDEAAAMTANLQPDVLLLDVRMERGDGLAALDKIHEMSPATKTIVLSSYENPTYVARAFALGVSQYLLKGLSRDELLTAIQQVASHRPPAHSDVLSRISSVMGAVRCDVDEGASLTMRESQVLRHVALGLSNKEISRSLAISVETVKENVQNLIRKIHVADRTQAAVWAVKRDLV